uniref:Uncharacterized protein n=1 Tax=Stomoxys calcitrans TaxID=35570 RepID=A0A1I8NVE8_STOCA
MIIIKCILIILIIPINHADIVQQQLNPFTPVWQPPPPPPCPDELPLPHLPQLQMRHISPPQYDVVGIAKPLRNSTDINFMLPFLDIDIQIERSIHVMQNSNEGQREIFILHGHELFQMFLGHKEKHLSLMAYLEGSVKIMEPLTAEIISQKGHYLLVVALDEFLEVYTIRRDILENRAEILKDPSRYVDPAPRFQPLQQITLHGKLQKLILTSVPNDGIMIITGVNFSKVHGKIRTFKWSNKRFDPLEELTLPALSVVTLMGSGSKRFLITGKVIKPQAKTILSIYEIEQSTLHLRNKQTLTVDSLLVHCLTFQKSNLIVACSSKQTNCKSYLQSSDGNFVVYKQRAAKEFVFDHLNANTQFILASQQNRVMIFPDHNLDSYGSFVSDIPSISAIMSHNGLAGENYALMFFKTPYRLLIRVVEIELGTKYRKTRATDDEDSSLLTQHKQLLVLMAEQLREFLPRRRQTLLEQIFNPQPQRQTEPNVLRRMGELLLPQNTDGETQDEVTNLFHRMVDVIEPEPDERDTSIAINRVLNRMLDVVQPQERQEETNLFSLSTLESVFSNIANVMTSNQKREVNSDSPVNLAAGKVGKIKILNKSLRSPMQILAKITELREKFSAMQREKRSLSGMPQVIMNPMKHIKARKLRVKNLIYSGDIIEGLSLDSSKATLTAKRKIKTQILNATEIVLPSINRTTRQFIPDLYYGLTPSIRSKHLNVASVNGFPWSKFYESVFLKNRDTSISGRLVFQNQLNVDHLKVEFLNHVEVDKLFNLRTPQVVDSQLLISRFFVHNLQAETVNGLKFEEDVVFSGREAFVETPVTMHYLSIAGDLIVADKKIERFSPTLDELEFKQFYTNKVVINGTLVLNNVRRDRENTTKIEIDGEVFQEQAIKEKYLLKSHEQHFPFPVIFDNGKITAPSLKTQYLNEHPTNEHMLINSINSSKPLLIVFMKSQVDGDIICRDYKSKIAEIQENIIRPGEKAIITGKKRFEAPLAIENLQATTLNDLKVSDLVFKLELEAPIIIRDSKRFEKIIVRNPCFVEVGIDAMFLNKLPLEDLLNYDYHMDSIDVHHPLLASNVVFHKINGIPFDEFFTKLNIKDDHLILRKDLIVEGNVLFAEPLELQYINDLDWNIYVTGLARNNEDAVIEGNVCFYGDVRITDTLQAVEVNNYNLQDILNNILLKSKPQLITGQYTFDNFEVTNLDVLSINDRTLDDFVDVSKNYTEFRGDIIASKLLVKGSVEGSLNEPIDFAAITKDVQELTKKPWRNLRVLHNVSWTSGRKWMNTQQELLKYLYKYAVKSKGNQVISGNVRLVRPLIKNINTRFQFPANLDFSLIEKDAVKKNHTSRQIIKGFKDFQQPAYVEEMETRKDLKTKTINNIDVLLFNSSLYRLSSKAPLQGPLKFLQPLQIGHISLKGLLNGLNTSMIYQIGNNSSLPAVVVSQLFIDNNVEVKKINHMDMEYFLDNRVTLNGPPLEIFGHLTFENVIIENAVLVQNINHIPVDNMVFKHSPHLQTITGHKTISGQLELFGPAHVMRLNNKELMETYRNTLVSHRNYQFDNLIVEMATFEKGLNILNSNMQLRSFEGIEQHEAKDHFKEFLNTINDKLKTNMGTIFYLDYDTQTKIKWQNSSNVAVDKIALSELARKSLCEKQYIKISYSLENHEMFLENITSNRISAFFDNVTVKAENYCKLKQRKVRSKISINTAKVLKVFGMKRFVETIYIVSVKGQQYVLLHALDLPSLKRNEVRVFRIDNRNNTIEEWQGLTQNIGEKLKVFQTPSLTTFVTNGLVEHHPALSIYRFEESLQKFKFLQIIEGFYDIIEMVSLHNGSYEQLVISCHKCQKIFIYDYNSEEEMQSPSSTYEIYQILSFNFNIDKVFMFSVQEDQYMMVISHKETSYFNLYKYTYIGGWKSVTHGYYPNLHMSIPLSQTWDGNQSFELSDNSDSIGLMILCNIDNCHLINAVVQN